LDSRRPKSHRCPSASIGRALLGGGSTNDKKRLRRRSRSPGRARISVTLSPGSDPVRDMDSCGSKSTRRGATRSSGESSCIRRGRSAEQQPVGDSVVCWPQRTMSGAARRLPEDPEHWRVPSGGTEGVAPAQKRAPRDTPTLHADAAMVGFGRQKTGVHRPVGGRDYPSQEAVPHQVCQESLIGPVSYSP
jgi:hypothetical protein